MNRIALKHRLLDKGMTLAELSHETSIPYDRLIKIIGQYRRARPEELTAIASALEVPERLLDAPKHSPGGKRSPRSHPED